MPSPPPPALLDQIGTSVLEAGFRSFVAALARRTARVNSAARPIAEGLLALYTYPPSGTHSIILLLHHATKIGKPRAEQRQTSCHASVPWCHAFDPGQLTPSCRRHTGAPQARLDPPPRTPLRRRLVSIRLPGGELGVGSCPRLALRAAWSPSSSPSCALRADRPLQVVPRPTPLSPARASRLLRLSRALRARRPSRPRGPAPAVHARPRQRLGLGRSALVGDVAAAARREPRRRPGAMANGSRLPHLVSGS